MPTHITPSLRGQLILMVLVVALPVAGIIIYSGLQQRRDAMEDAYAETARLAESVAREQDHVAAGAYQLVTTLAQLPEVRGFRQDKVQPILAEVLRINPQYINIFITDLAGNIKISAVPLKGPTSVADRRYFINAMKTGRFSSGEYVISRAVGRATLNFGFPFNDTSGNIAGVIAVGLNLDSFRTVFQKAGLPHGSNFLFTDHRGIILNRGLDPSLFIGRSDRPEVFRRMTSGEKVSFEAIGNDGFRRLFSCRKVLLPGEESPYLYVRVGIPVEAIVAKATIILLKNLLFLTGFLLLALFLARMIGKRSIIDPVERLLAASRTIAGGDLEVRVSESVAGGELGALAREFDDMAQQLARREQLRQEAEDSLREREANYREVFNGTKDALFLHDSRSGAILQVNRAAEEMFGYSHEEFMQWNLSTISHGPPYTDEEARDRILRVRTDGVQNFEWLCARKNGDRFWAEVVLSPTTIGGKGCVLAVVRDIDERKKALAEMLREKESAQRYLDIAGVLFTALDDEGCITLMNIRGGEILGYAEEELVGKNWFDTCIPPEAREQQKKQFLSVMNGTALPAEFHEERIFTSDGTVRIIAVHSVLLREGETIMGLLFSGEDITVRKQVEQDLKLKNFAVEKLVDAVLWLSADGSLWDANEAACRFLGYSRSELVSLHVGEVDPNLSGDGWRRHWETLRKVGSEQFESSLMRRDGTMIPVFTTTGYFRYDDREYICAIVRDLTEQRQAEDERKLLMEQLNQSRKLEAVGRLAGGIAHDFNNLLTPIMGYADILRESLPQGQKEWEHVDRISQAAEKARKLVQQLLGFGRKQILNMQVLDMNKVLLSFYDILRRTIRENIDLRIDLTPDVYGIRADMNQLEQIIMNLAVNAQDAITDRGTITFETAPVTIDAEYARQHAGVKPGRYLMVAVTDDGYGMDKETLDNIFEPFFTTKGHGTGLGLATVYGLVKQHGGNIWAYSEPGIGSVFKIYFPIVEEGPVQEQVDSPERGIPTACSILLVEDNDVVREMIHEVLMSQGYRVTVAAGPSEALTMMDTEVDILLTDVIMPEMDGPELHARMLERQPKLKVLYMSGYTDNVIVVHGVLLKGVNFIQKPFTINDLLAKLEKTLLSS